MKSLIAFLGLLLLSSSVLYGQDSIEFESNQSMCISGKGAGQDGAINPYLGQDCYAIVKNKGVDTFTVRVEKGERNIIQSFDIKKNQIKKILLKKDMVLYIDTDIIENAIAEISFEAIKED